jgi:hypothetical protein
MIPPELSIRVEMSKFGIELIPGAHIYSWQNESAKLKNFAAAGFFKQHQENLYFSRPSHFPG